MFYEIFKLEHNTIRVDIQSIKIRYEDCINLISVPTDFWYISERSILDRNGKLSFFVWDKYDSI